MKYKPSNANNRNEGGFVAIFSVIFFALLAIIITVGFIRITVREQEQALNNDLTARALAAAEAGVEDAKRAINHYLQLPDGSEKDNFLSAFESEDCEGIYGNSTIRNALDLNTNGQLTGEQNLYYPCLNVDLDTPDYVETVPAGESAVIPLRATGSFDKVELEWHLVSDVAGSDGDGEPSGYPSDLDALPTVSEFNNAGNRPAYMRVQLIAAPKSGINRNDLEERSRTVFLIPVDNRGRTQVNIQGSDPRGFNKTKGSPAEINCRDAAVGQYACSVSLALPVGDYPPNTNKLFLQVTSLYRDTHIRAKLFDGNDPRAFKAVQPRIVATGQAADVFRRISVRVSTPGSTHQLLRYGAQVGDNICKQFQVTGQQADYSDAAAGKC